MTQRGGKTVYCGAVLENVCVVIVTAILAYNLGCCRLVSYQHLV